MSQADAEDRTRTLRADLSRVKTSLVSEGVMAMLGERTRKFTTGHRLVVIALVTFLPLGFISYVLASGLETISLQSRSAVAVGERVVTTLPVSTELAEAEEQLGTYLVSGTEVDRAAFAAQAGVVDRAFAAVAASAQASVLDEVVDARDLWDMIRTQSLAGEGLPDDPAARAAMASTFTDAFTSIQGRLITISEEAAVAAVDTSSDHAQRAHSLRLLILIGVPLSFFFGLSLVSWLIRDLRHGTGQLRDAAARIQDGQLDVRVDVTHGDLAPVARAFNAMAARIERQQRELHHVANRDELTGVLNRRGFDDELRTEIERAERYGSHLALLLLDIDHFKRVNDTFGHPVGDVVLQAVAHEIGQAVRGVDRVGRWGGEEFAVLLPETEVGAARHVARRINQVIAQRVVITDGHKLRVTASVGVTVHDPADGAIAIEELVERADRALYEAKETGRNRVVFAS